VISVPIFLVQLAQVSGRNRGPIFRERVGRGLALDLGNGFFDFVNDFAAPGCERRGVRPFLPEQKFLGNFQAVASEREFFIFGST
jgi:hypothetical protein